MVRRLSAERDVTLALFELRLEAARRPAVAEALNGWRQSSFGEDVGFNAAAGLPGDRPEIALFHYAIDGLTLDHLTAPLNTGMSIDTAIDEFVRRILG